MPKKYNTEKYNSYKMGYVARNKGDLKDLNNMSFFNTKKEAIKCFGDTQEILKVMIIFIDKNI